MFSSSPKLIAAYHVFHRLLTPRHPPVALCNLFLTSRKISFHSLFNCKRTPDTHVSAASHQREAPSACSDDKREYLRGCDQTWSGGGGRNRTDDPLRARQVLSQLSYAPRVTLMLVGLDRLELSTSRLSGVRSNHLSYRPPQTAAFLLAAASGSFSLRSRMS